MSRFEPPSLVEVVKTDWNVARLVHMGYGLAVVLVIFLVFARIVVRQEYSDLAFLAVIVPIAGPLLAGLLWARAIQACFEDGVAVPGVVLSRSKLFGFVSVSFEYEHGGRQRRRKNHLVPRRSVERLEAGRAVTILLSRSFIPGPIVKEAYR